MQNEAGGPAGIVQLKNGCICCTFRDDLLKEMLALLRYSRADFDVLEVASTHIVDCITTIVTQANPINQFRRQALIIWSLKDRAFRSPSR